VRRPWTLAPAALQARAPHLGRRLPHHHSDPRLARARAGDLAARPSDSCGERADGRDAQLGRDARPDTPAAPLAQPSVIGGMAGLRAASP